MAVIYSRKNQLRKGEYGAYFINVGFNCFKSPSSLELIIKRRLLNTSPTISGNKSKYILIKYQARNLVDSYKSLIDFAISQNIKFIAVPCPLLALNNFIELKQLLCESYDDINIRMIISDKHLRYLNHKNDNQIYDFVNRNYKDPNIRYSIVSDNESIERAKKTKREREERYKKSIDYTNHVKLSVDELKREIDNKSLLLEKTFSETLFDMINEKQMTDVEVYKRANLDKRHFSKIRSNQNYKPSKETVLSLCIALKLNIEETEFLLNTIGASLSRSNLSDMIVKAFIINEIYDLDQLNLYLLERNLKPLTYY